MSTSPIIERVALTPDAYLSLDALADYSGISVRQIRNLIADPARPLPCYRIGRRVTVRRSDYDAWASAYRQVGVDIMGQIERLQRRRRRRRVTHAAS
jgi:predicted DNA-binding transcriptional regulator AlpA